jgi:hypothetical protein
VYDTTKNLYFMEVNNMTGKRIWKVIFALVIVVGLILGGVAIYQAGFTHGAMTNLTLPEGSEYPQLPYGHAPYGRSIGPRVGLLGLFPLMCFGGFFFLLLIFGFGFCARRRAWMHYDPEARHYWKHHGPPPGWGADKPPGAEDQSQTESDTPPKEVEET